MNGLNHLKHKTEAAMDECVAAMLEAEAAGVAGAGTLYPTPPLLRTTATPRGCQVPKGSPWGSSGAGTYWSRRESGGLPPDGTQMTIDTALESSRCGDYGFVE